jgi:hypothetical protein
MKQANQQATEQPTLRRRKLLGAAGTTGALAAGAALLTQREPEAAAPVDGDAATQQANGYRLSEHVLRYYKTTRV